MTPKHYFGNYPNSSGYDPNIPIGWNKWDAMEGDDPQDKIPTDDAVDDEDDWEGNYGQQEL